VPHFFEPLLRFVFHLGYLAPFVMGVFDSSFLFLPFGNDLLLVVLISQHQHHNVPLLILSGALGSTLGVFLVSVVAGKAGEEGLKKMAGERRSKRLEAQVTHRGGWAIILATLAPPPFPFTTVIAAAAAFQYPRVRLLALNFLGRAARFAVLAWLALRFGPAVLRIIDSTAFRWSMTAFIALCLIGSGVSIWHWVRHSRPGERR
jgi:membrane protein YqaA with SNARE-associated domain